MSRSLYQSSVHIYSYLLKLYPKKYQQEFGKEMKYVFSAQLKDSYNESKHLGIIQLWARTIIDVGKSSIHQHVESKKERSIMKRSNSDILMNNNVFIWIAVITGFILMIPLTAMQFSKEWNWQLSDFIVAGALVFGAGSLFILIARNFKNSSHRLLIGVLCALLLLWLYAELAVGIFTNWGS